jgi:hypothetical protein
MKEPSGGQEFESEGEVQAGQWPNHRGSDRPADFLAWQIGTALSSPPAIAQTGIVTSGGSGSQESGSGARQRPKMPPDLAKGQYIECRRQAKRYALAAAAVCSRHSTPAKRTAAVTTRFTGRRASAKTIIAQALSARFTPGDSLALALRARAPERMESISKR